MHNGQCPKCNSSNVFLQRNGASFGSRKGVYLFTSSMAGASDYDSYVCVNCGYFENYIVDTAKLQEIQKVWTKATG